jgi:hypothetical protein
LTLQRLRVCRFAAGGCLVVFLFVAGGCGGPVWYLDPGFAERLAAKEKKPLLLYFKAWDSSVHRNMRLEVFENAAVKAELRCTVNAELEYAYFKEWTRRFGVRQPQVCVMATPDGKRVASPLYVNPVPTPEKFLDWLKKARAEAMAACAAPK